MSARTLAVVLALAALAAACGDDAARATSGSTGGGPGRGGGSGDSGATSTTQTGATGGAAATGSSSSSSTGASSTSAGSGGSAPEQLSILAWNVESFPKTSSAPDIVGQVIANELPMVAAFEEVDSVAQLEAALDSATDYDVVTENERPYALVAAVDHARATILDAGAIFEEDTYLFPRSPLVARIEVLATGFQFDLVVVHQKAQVDEESEQRRRDANVRLAAWCDTRSAATASPIVLVGDFNDQVTDAGANDVFTAFKSAKDPSYWFPTAPLESTGEFSYIPFESFIDHQIATDDLHDAFSTAKVSVLHLENEVTNYVSRVSDHRPVRVDFLP